MDQQPTQIQQHQTQQPHSAGPTDSPHQDEGSRGRRRTRDNEDNDEDDGQDDDGTGNGSSKKRRRSRKGLDKKFECPHDGCGKSYSRAEHLYRHQLNRRWIPFSLLPFVLSRVCPKASIARTAVSP